jgi:hypothetical protein
LEREIVSCFRLCIYTMHHTDRTAS